MAKHFRGVKRKEMNLRVVVAKLTQRLISKKRFSAQIRPSRKTVVCLSVSLSLCLSQYIYMYVYINTCVCLNVYVRETCRYDINGDFLKRNTRTHETVGSGYLWTMGLRTWNGKETSFLVCLLHC